MAHELPDELWRKILELGIRISDFSYKDLCCLSISCRRLRRLSCEDSLWSNLLSSDFPRYSSLSSPSPSSAKSLYRSRFERERERKVLAHKRVVLRKESQIADHSLKLREIDGRTREETDRLKSTIAELGNLLKVRQASVALNVWQPETVRGRQKQMVEQCAVPIESRVHALEMEVKLCRQQIAALAKAHRDENQRLEKAKEELESLKYHPLCDYKSTANQDSVTQNNLKRRKLKTCLSGPEKRDKII